MAPAFEIRPGQPDVLIVYDDDIYNGGQPNFDRLHAFLDDAPAGCPVRAGTHDYWIVHPFPRTGVASAVSELVNTHPEVRPRPMRGEIQMLDDFEGLLDPSKAVDYLNTLAQEVAHYWLAYANRMQIDGQQIALSSQFMQAVNTGARIPDLCLIGRSDAHWSSFLQADASPLDGEHWDDLAETSRSRSQLSPPGPGGVVPEGGGSDSTILRHYRQRQLHGPDVTVPGLFAPVTTGQTYCDLDLMVMGIISPHEAYRDTGGAFDCLTPQWEVGPLTFQAGLALVFDTNDIIMFGFQGGFTRLVIERTGQALESFDLGGVYHPWSLDERLLLRIVRRGNQYYFQGRPERGTIGCLGEVLRRIGLYRPPAAVDPFSGLAALPAAVTTNLTDTDWNTFATETINETPQALCYIVKTWDDKIPVVDFSGRPLRLRDESTPGRPTERTISDVSATVSGTDYLTALHAGEYTYHLPRNGPARSDLSGTQRLIVTTHLVHADSSLQEVGPFDHRATVDNAPKLATLAPAGDFTVAGSIRLERDTMGPGSAGAHTGMELWAYRHRFNIGQVDLTQGAYGLQAPPPEDTFAAAFIVVAPTIRQPQGELAELPGPVVLNVDRLRQAWEDYFPKATRNRRAFDTRLARS